MNELRTHDWKKGRENISSVMLQSFITWTVVTGPKFCNINCPIAFHVIGVQVEMEWSSPPSDHDTNWSFDCSESFAAVFW